VGECPDRCIRFTMCNKSLGYFRVVWTGNSVGSLVTVVLYSPPGTKGSERVSPICFGEASAL